MINPGKIPLILGNDRAGRGDSEPAPPVPPARARRWSTTTTLLRVAAVPGPDVLVDHSIAGFNVQVFAPEDGGDTVVGVVPIDATPPDIIPVRHVRRRR